MKNQMEIESNKIEKVQTRSAWQMIQTYFNVLNNCMASIAAVYMTFMCYNAGNKAISWHAWLCSVGVSGFLLENFIYRSLFWKIQFDF